MLGARWRAGAPSAGRPCARRLVARAGIIPIMGGMGSTRVFGHGASGVDVVGLRRRPARDLYHSLVTGSWTRLLSVYAIVYFGVIALFAVGRVLVSARLPASGSVVD